MGKNWRVFELGQEVELLVYDASFVVFLQLLEDRIIDSSTACLPGRFLLHQHRFIAKFSMFLSEPFEIYLFVLVLRP